MCYVLYDIYVCESSTFINSKKSQKKMAQTLASLRPSLPAITGPVWHPRRISIVCPLGPTKLREDR